MGQRIRASFLGLGFVGIMSTLYLGLMWAPSVANDAFESPAAQRIFYWHVPSAWASFIAFAVLFVGSALWFFKRSPTGWRLHVAGAEAGLAESERQTARSMSGRRRRRRRSANRIQNNNNDT